MEALVLGLALTSGLTDVNGAVRETEAYTLAGQLAVFPPRDVMYRHASLATSHLTWLQNQLDLGPVASGVTSEDVDEQKRVVAVYNTLGDARFWSDACFRGFNYGELPLVEGDDGENYDEYLELTKDRIESLKVRLGKENFVIGRLPMPLPCMDRP